MIYIKLFNILVQICVYFSYATEWYEMYEKKMWIGKPNARWFEWVLAKFNWIFGWNLITALPRHDPIITGINQRYEDGDFLLGNCTSDMSSPPAMLSWYINDEKVITIFLFQCLSQGTYPTSPPSPVTCVKYCILIKNFYVPITSHPWVCLSDWGISIYTHWEFMPTPEIHIISPAGTARISPTTPWDNHRVRRFSITLPQFRATVSYR